MGPDDLEQISAAMKPLMAAAGVPALDKNSIYAFFVDRRALGLPGGGVGVAGGRVVRLHEA